MPLNDAFQDGAFQDGAFQDGAFGADSSAPAATGVAITGVLRNGQTLTGNYTYVANGLGPEGTSTFRWLRDDVAIGGATSQTYTLTASDVGADIKFEVTPVAASAESGIATESIAYGPVGATLSGNPIVAVWPDDYILQSTSGAPQVDISGYLTGRDSANVVRMMCDTDNENPTNAVAAANANFTQDGYNVLMVGNNLYPLLNTILYEYDPELRGGLQGWFSIQAWWEAIIDAIFDAGHRIDAVAFDFERVTGSDFGREPDGTTAAYETLPNIYARVVTMAGTSTANMPAIDYDAYSDTEDPGHYAARSAFNDAVHAIFRQRVDEALVTKLLERNPGIIVSQYESVDWAATQTNPNDSNFTEPDGKLYNSAPVLYYDYDTNRELLENVDGDQTPWATTTAPTQADDKAFGATLDQAIAASSLLTLVWGSKLLTQSRTVAAPDLSALAQLDLQQDFEDTSGNTNHGTATGSLDATDSYVQGPGGYLRGAYVFDGSTDYVDVPDTLAGTTGSISLWVYTSDLVTDRLALGSDGTNRRFIGVDSSGNLYARVQDGSAFGLTAVSADEWHHVVLNWTPTGAEFFVDKVSVGTDTRSISAASALSIGSFDEGTGQFWQGRIAGARFFSTVSDSTRINALYDEAKPQFFDSPSIFEDADGQLAALHTPSDGVVSVQWKRDGNNIGTNNHRYTPGPGGDYTVEITLTNDQGTTVLESSSVEVEGSISISAIVARRSHQQLNIPAGY